MKKGRFLGLIWAAAALFGSGISGAAAQEGVFPELIPGEVRSGRINLGGKEGVRYQTFRVSVPSTAYALRLSLEDAPADLDLFIRYGAEIQDYEETDFQSTQRDFNEELSVTRMTGEGLQTGVYYVDVVYQLDEVPVINGKPSKVIPFQLACDILRARVDQRLEPGEGVSSQLVPEEGMFRTFAVDVPPGAEVLRVDLYNAFYDMDIFISRKSPLLTRENSRYTGESVMAWESVVVRRDGPFPLETGTHYITVVDQVSQALPEEFSVVASFSEDPPEFLQKIPPLPETENRVQGLLNATVQIVGGSGSGSGTLVSPDGLILSNDHVVRGQAGGSDTEVVVAVNMTNDLPPQELFQAEILRRAPEKDLVLLRVTSGIYGQPLPEGYSFPWIPLGDSGALSVADPLALTGYPWIGGTGSRVSVTYTEGVVAGFERTARGTLIKTDGDMNYGNSGGAALNQQGELVGVPSSVVNEDAGQLGYLRPVDSLPAEWRRMIRARQP